MHVKGPAPHCGLCDSERSYNKAVFCQSTVSHFGVFLLRKNSHWENFQFSCTFLSLRCSWLTCFILISDSLVTGWLWYYTIGPLCYRHRGWMPMGNKFDMCFQMYLLIGRVIDDILKENLFIKLKFNFLLGYLYFCGEHCCLVADNTWHYYNCT